LKAIQVHGCGYLIALPWAGPFVVPAKWPGAVILIGDDTDAARGPAAFDAPSMGRVLRTCERAVVVSSGPEPTPYKIAANAAIAGRHALLVETRPEQEIPWLQFIQAAAPALPILVSTVKGGTA